MKRRHLLGLVYLVMGLVMECGFLSAQTEVKEKPPMYTYVSIWAMPRAQWPALEKDTSTDAILQKALASGGILGYGRDRTIVHQEDGWTHDDWWAATSMAGLMNVLDQIYASGNATNPVLSSATKHEDLILVSRFYNYRPGSWKNVYGHGGFYKLKANAPDDAIDMLSKNLFVPFFEKLMADGTIYEYEVDEEAIHTMNPDMFTLFYLCANAECLDKVNAALRAWQKASPLGGPTFSSMTDSNAHRDELLRADATYK